MQMKPEWGLQVLFLRGRLPQAEAAARRCLALLQPRSAGDHSGSRPGSGDRAPGADVAVVAAKLRLGAILMGAQRAMVARPLAHIRGWARVRCRVPWIACSPVDGV